MIFLVRIKFSALEILSVILVGLRISTAATATSLTALSSREPEDPASGERSPLARIRLPSRDKCGAQRRAREVI